MRKLHVEIFLPGRPGEDLLRDSLKKTAALYLLGMDPLLIAKNQHQARRLETLCDDHNVSWLKDYIAVKED